MPNETWWLPYFPYFALLVAWILIVTSAYVIMKYDEHNADKRRGKHEREGFLHHHHGRAAESRPEPPMSNAEKSAQENDPTTALDTQQNAHKGS